MKRSMAALGAVAVAAVLALVPVTAASAHTPTVSSTCEAITVNATSYETKPGTDAVTEQRLVSEAYDDTIVVTPAQDAVYKTEYKFVHKFDFFHLNPKWKDDPNWNAEGNPQSTGWIYTGQTRQTLVSEAVPAVTQVVHHDAVYETVVITPAVPADPTPNTVVISIDGVEVVNTNFGHNYSNVISVGNQYVAHDYTVTITAWNDPDGSKGWTRTFTGTTTPCEVPIVEPNHGASIAATCGAATVTLTNDEAEYEDNLTASFTVWVDGSFYGAYAVVGGASEQIDLTFSEDSGDHTVVVRAGDAQGGAVLAEETVESDCILPQPEPQVVPGEWSQPVITCENEVGDEVEITREVTTTPYILVEGEWVLDTENAETTTESDTYVVTEEDIEALDCPVPPVDEEEPPVVDDLPDTDALAYTGADTAPVLWAGGALLSAGAIALTIALLRRRAASQQ